MDDKKFPKRKRNRLYGYDYSEEKYYFVTICTQNRKNLLANIVGDGFNRPVKVTHTYYGLIAKRHLLDVPSHFENVFIDKYVIMPNHIHAIIVIGCSQTVRSRPSPTLSTIVGQYKSGVSRQLGFPLWQRSFYDHIIRKESDYEEIWKYIDENPAKWFYDSLYEIK